MTEVPKKFRLRVYETDGTTVDFTETTDISGHGPVGGQRVEPLQARTSARPWDVTIADVGEKITARLADSDGRAQLLRRLGDWSVSTDDGSSWTVLATGRIDKVSMVGVSAFRFTFQDERLIERNVEIFTDANTTRLAPAGLDQAWGRFQPDATFSFQVSSVDATNNKTRYDAVGFTRPALNQAGMRVRDDALELMAEDVVSNPQAHQGNFTHLRASIDGTDREVETLNKSRPADPLGELEDDDDEVTRVDSFTVAGFQDPLGAGGVREVFLHMPTRAPTKGLPKHIGGQAGIDPFQFAKDAYDGDHQDASNPQTVRYDSTVFSTYDANTNPDGLIGRFPPIHLDPEGPERMDKVLDREVYGPHGVVPLVNADGEISPRLGRLPASDQAPDPTTLFQFTAANLTDPHPGWVNEGRDQVTVVRVNFTFAKARFFRAEESDRRLDGLKKFDSSSERTHDNIGTVGRLVHEIEMNGLHYRGTRRDYIDRVSREIFDLFGDGPVYYTLNGTSATDGVDAGDLATIDLDTLPSLQNQSRSGTRLIRVLSKTIEVGWNVFEVIELGPSNQPLGTPSVSVAASSSDPENAIDVTISGLNSGEGYELNIAENATEPGESSDAWQYRVVRGDTNETRTVRRVPSGSTLWARARATQDHRISSDWSTADSQATTALSAATSVAASDVAGDVATITWTVGETDYDVKVDLDGDFEARLVAGATEYTFEGLAQSTSFTPGVRHVDDYGGESSRATGSFTTTSSDEAVATPEGIRVLVG